MSKLLYSLNDQIILRKLEDKKSQIPPSAICKIFGACPGKFIMIDLPVVKIGDEPVDMLMGEVDCSLFHDGSFYYFRSEVRESIRGEYCLIDYPTEFTIKKLRRHKRIKVNLEGKLLFAHNDPLDSVSILDISEGGCYLMLPKFRQITPDMLGTLSFTLPGNIHVQLLESRVKYVRPFPQRNRIDIGIQFVGPSDEMKKVVEFCRFCTSFSIE